LSSHHTQTCPFRSVHHSVVYANLTGVKRLFKWALNMLISNDSRKPLKCFDYPWCHYTHTHTCTLPPPHKQPTVLRTMMIKNTKLSQEPEVWHPQTWGCCQEMFRKIEVHVKIIKCAWITPPICCNTLVCSK
jgi:hypothetical protein